MDRLCENKFSIAIAIDRFCKGIPVDRFCDPIFGIAIEGFCKCIPALWFTAEEGSMEWLCEGIEAIGMEKFCINVV